MTEWNDPIEYPEYNKPLPSESNRRHQGSLDAAAKKPALSRDKHYLIGYNLYLDMINRKK